MDPCLPKAPDPEIGSIDFRAIASGQELSVVVHVPLARTRVTVQVTARAPAWQPFVKLPDALVLHEGDFATIVRAARKAFRVWRATFGK